MLHCKDYLVSYTKQLPHFMQCISAVLVCHFTLWTLEGINSKNKATVKMCELFLSPLSRALIFDQAATDVSQSLFTLVNTPTWNLSQTPDTVSVSWTASHSHARLSFEDRLAKCDTNRSLKLFFEGCHDVRVQDCYSISTTETHI